uniref:SH3 and multiple ankyrin repeat domains protein 3 n=1 Tax=Amphimedon queenslandica TaxID=400682 RepID=A0A1X7UNN6_AMPQE
MDEHDGAGILVRVDVPDLKSQTRIVIGKTDPVGYAKQAVLEKLSHDWPIDVANNYGFYIPPTGRKKVGRFLDESRPLVEEQSGVITHLELRYKRRDLSALGLSEKALAKANSKSNMKKLVDHVTSGSIKKIEKLLDSGLDPNFIMEDGNTPLGLACGRQGRSQCISPLIYGGAIIDFRGSAGLTPIHRAAIGGNTQALKILLSFGASPNYTDVKGTTPLYHAAIMGDDVTVCELLLKNNSIVGNTDIIGWTELHQIAKHGHVHMIDALLAYAADINAVNKAGNTPLHVAAQHGQLDAAIHLLKRGANPYILNSSHQPPNQSAILCGHHNLAKEIANFMKEDMDPVDPSESEPAGERWGTERRGSLGSREKEMSPTSYSSKTLPSSSRGKPGAAVGAPKLIKGQSLTNLSQQKTQVPTLSTSPPTKYNITKKAPVMPTGSKRGPKGKSVEEDTEVTEGSPRTESLAVPQSRKHRYSTDRKTSPKSLHQSPTPAPMPGTPPLAIRERLYPVGTPGKKYFVTMNVDPEQEGDLHLTRGMTVDVLYVGKGGFWEGKVGDVTGWFPQHAITEKMEGWDDQAQQAAKEEKGSEKIPGIKSVTLSKGPKGFGFAMRGIKAVNAGANCKLTPEIPALQYVGRIDKGSSADMSGLQKGDFIIEVNGVNTTKSTHEEVVGIIKQSNSDKLHLKVITPLKKGAVTSSSKQPKEESKGSHEEPPLAAQELPTYPTGGSSPKQQAWGMHSEENEGEGATNYTQSPLPPQPISMTPPDKKRVIIQALPSSSPKLQTRGSPSASPLLSNVKKSSPLVKHSLHAKDTSSDKKEIEALTSNKDPGGISSSRSEELLQREEENYKLMMKEDEEEEEEGLSELAKQLRKASRERYKRTKERDDQLPPPSSPSQSKVPVTNASTSRPPNDNNVASNTSSPKSISSHITTMKPAQSIHKTESSTVTKPQSPVAPLKHDLLAEPVKDDDDDDDDGWEYTEALTAYADVVPPATTSEQKEHKIDTTSNKSKTEKQSLSKREEQAALRVEHLKKGYLSSKQNATASSPKSQHTQKPSSPKQEQSKQKVPSSPKTKSSPLVSHHQSSYEQSSASPKASKQKDASPPKQQQQSPSLLLKEEKYTSSQQMSLKSDNFDEKEPVTSSAATFMPKNPPPIKPKPSVGKEVDDLPSSIAAHNTSSTSAAASVASLAKNFSSPKKSRRDYREKLQYSKKNISNDTASGHAQEKSISSLKETSPKEEEPEEPEPEPQPVMSLKDKFEKMAQSKKPPPPGPIKPKPKKQPEPVKPAPEPVKPVSEPAPEPVKPVSEPAPEPVKQVKPVFEPLKPDPEPIPPEPNETFLPPPVFEEFTDSNRFSIISLEELPIPAELLNDDSLEEENNDFLPPPPLVEDEEMNASFELPPPPLSLAHSSDEEAEPEIPAPPFTPTIESFSAIKSESKATSNEDKELQPPVETKEERDGESTKESKKEADHKPSPPPENNLLDDIVGKLVKLTTGGSSDEDIDSDSDSAGSPPPLPSGPPPDSDEEENKEDNRNLQEPLIIEALDDAPGNKGSTSIIEDSSLELHHEVPLPPPQRDSVFFDDGFDDSAEDFIPPPTLEEEDEDNTFEPPPFIEDTLPPPFDEEDLLDEQLPPPFDDEFLPPPFDEDTDLVLPAGPIPVPENDDDLPPPIFDDETSDNEFSYDLLPPVPMLLDEEEKENEEFLPPPSPPSFPSPPPPLSSSDALNDHSNIQKDDNVTVTTQVSSTEHNTAAEENSSAPVSSWSVDRVCSWLTEIGLEMHTDTFRSNEIYGEHLIDLSRDDLKDLGITKVGHIKTLRQKLNERLQS